MNSVQMCLHCEWVHLCADVYILVLQCGTAIESAMYETVQLFILKSEPFTGWLANRERRIGFVINLSFEIFMRKWQKCWITIFKADRPRQTAKRKMERERERFLSCLHSNNSLILNCNRRCSDIFSSSNCRQGKCISSSSNAYEMQYDFINLHEIQNYFWIYRISLCSVRGGMRTAEIQQINL